VAFTLKYCVEKSIYSASDFKAILELQQSDRKAESIIKLLNPLNGKVTENALIQPEKSNIGEYEAIINNKKPKKSTEQPSPRTFSMMGSPWPKLSKNGKERTDQRLLQAV
jgi:hypothetical protein